MYTDKDKLTVLETAIYLENDIKSIMDAINSGKLKSFVENGVTYIKTSDVDDYKIYLNSFY